MKILKMKMVITCCILLSALALNAQESLAGIWNMGQENTKIEITEENGVYEGKIASSDNSKAKIGKQLLKEVRLVNGKWKGKFYAPKKDKWFDAVLKEKGDKLKMTVGAGIRSKTLTWTKE